MKKILISLGVFTLSLLFFTWMFFPYQSIFSHYTERALKTYKIPLSYERLQAGMGSTVMSGVVFNYQKGRQSQVLDIGDLKIGYSILSLLTKSVDVDIRGDLIQLSGDVSKTAAEFDMTLDMAKLDIPDKPEMVKGQINLVGDLDIVKNEGVLTLVSDKLVVKSDFGPITLTGLKGNVDYKKNVLTITDLSSQGKTKVSVDGKIFLNTKNISLSRFQLKGKMDMSGLKQKITVSGTLSNPRINLR